MALIHFRPQFANRQSMPGMRMREAALAHVV